MVDGGINNYIKIIPSKNAKFDLAQTPTQQLVGE